MQKNIKNALIIFFAVIFVFVPLKFGNYLSKNVEANAIEIPEDEKWTDYDNYNVISQDTIWSGNVVFDDVYKPVIIVDGATLTIEKGTHIELTDLFVFLGRIVAEGTAEENIVFTKAQLPADYDLNCGSPATGTVEFDDWSQWYGMEPSVMRFVEFKNMGTYESTDMNLCPEKPIGFNLRNMFFPVAHAASIAAAPALRFNSGRLIIENSGFTNNSHTDIEVNIAYYKDYEEYKDWLEIKNSNFEGNKQNYALTSFSIKRLDNQGNFIHDVETVKLTNNWYGDPNGPRVAGSVIGGEAISGDYTLEGYSSVKFNNSIIAIGASNVLFLPGLEASRLYGNSDSTCPYSEKAMNLAWEPNCKEDVRRLYLNSDGKSLNPIHTKEGDVVDETPIGANIYLSFVEQMNKMKNEDKLINDWKAVAYDWRLSPDDILSDDSIINSLRNLAENSKTKKVTIVAHSNGGLIAKVLMQKLGDEEAKKIIDKIVFVAVPQVGTPSAVAGMLHGYKQNFFPVLDTETARSFGENMPGAYNLLPSEQYFSSVDTPTVTFDTDSSSDWKARYDNPIHSKNGLHEFLSDTFRRVPATSSDVNIPAKLNESLLENAENLHDNLDNWTAPEGVKVIQIAGWGVPATLSSTQYDVEKGQICDGSVCSKNIDILDPDFKFTIDGDGTVVAPSALWMKDAERYWVDIGKWNKDHPFSTVFGFNSHDHSDILEIPEILTFIDNTIINNNIDIPQYFSKDVPQIGGHPNRLQYSLHSPLTLNLYDDQGRHTGINPVTGQVEEQIPGTYYRQIGDVKYIFSDEDSVGKIVMNGYDTGTFTFSVDEFQGDTLLGNITFKDMPTTPETEATIDIASNLASASSLNIDKNGDGTPDFSLQPKIGEIVTLDSISPTTEISIDSEKGTNNWHTSDAKITLTATDNENGSGVDKTEYSLDNGQTWSNYTEPINISQEGATTLQYFSTDKQGNKEEIKTETIKIDKTAPEAKIQFNSTTQKLDIIGTDNLTQNVSLLLANQPIINKSNPRAKKIKAWFSDWQKRDRDRRFSDIVATLVDEAGHTTVVVFMKTKDANNRIFVTIKSIAYDGAETTLAKTAMQYKWQIDRKKQYSQMASHIQSESAIVESHYLPKKNQTWLMEKPRELADDNGDDDSEKRPTRTKLSGMIIPMLITENGKVKVDY